MKLAHGIALLCGCIALDALPQHAALPLMQRTFESECIPPADEVLRLIDHANTVCPAAIQSHVLTEGGSSDLLVLDAQGGVRVAHDAGSERSFVALGPIADVGSDGNTIFWGRWEAGERRLFADGQMRSERGAVAMPYVGGYPPLRFNSLVPATGTATYRLLGSPRLISDKDYTGTPVEPGPIANATARVDFEGATAQVTVSYSVRGTAGTLNLHIARRRSGMRGTPLDDVTCDEHAIVCPSAELRFYGPEGEYAGLLIRFRQDTVLANAGASHLANVWSWGALALHRE